MAIIEPCRSDFRSASTTALSLTSRSSLLSWTPAGIRLGYGPGLRSQKDPHQGLQESRTAGPTSAARAISSIGSSRLGPSTYAPNVPASRAMTRPWIGPASVFKDSLVALLRQHRDSCARGRVQAPSRFPKTSTSPILAVRSPPASSTVIFKYLAFTGSRSTSVTSSRLPLTESMVFQDSPSTLACTV